ncbi:type I-E CRISPR-associated protein Cse2/CasB [Anaerococcus sp. AGMB09787]|uniref:type I-E CRISPR-associated protein Cse2/CasB n=1 Tax=Anaerococcus sp. AGMB09787 TaxID=2922869 RepID=UPI001FB03648|nr:type I-E CRISPR-associated protein Cse2/CasB [Anaerococcus sp. AGMB09787]
MSKENKKASVYGASYKMLKKIDTMTNEPSKKAILANLRCSINRPLGDGVGHLAFVFENMPDEFLGRGEYYSREEKAIITSLQLYALHQQGIRESILTEEKDNMGYSLSLLRDEDSKSYDRRFNALVTANDFEEFSYHLRQMVRLLKSKKKGEAKVNYANLARDLYSFLRGHEEGIRLKWARSYYSFRKVENKEKGEENEK